MDAGTTQVATPYRERIAALFSPHVDRSGDCWLWTGYCDPKGYGRITLSAAEMRSLELGEKRLVAKASRVALALSGVSLGSLHALHACDNPPCVRVHPDHVYAGTPAQNMADRVARNPDSWLSGERNPASKLTNVQRAEIRARRGAGEGVRALGREYGVSHPAIRKICA